MFSFTTRYPGLEGTVESEIKIQDLLESPGS